MDRISNLGHFFCENIRNNKNARWSSNTGFKILGSFHFGSCLTCNEVGLFRFSAVLNRSGGGGAKETLCTFGGVEGGAGGLASGGGTLI